LFKVANLAKKLTRFSQCGLRSAELEGRGMAEAGGRGAKTECLLILVDEHRSKCQLTSWLSMPRQHRRSRETPAWFI
jgi:hypothetical protein